MTHPIRLVAFLLAQEHNVSYRNLAEQALNGTMYGCCYGPYNLRNEIDRHNTTVGGHGSNTHFVTGDGGFINSFVSGFGGLMLGATQAGLRLSKPTVPERTAGLRFKGLSYLGLDLDYEVTATQLSFTIHSGEGSARDSVIANVATELCLVDANGMRLALASGGAPTSVKVAALSFPATLGPCSS
eukprot:SAG31_NODE_2973_length_4832_cov_11.390882_5_plen_185_part_00